MVKGRSRTARAKMPVAALAMLAIAAAGCSDGAGATPTITTTTRAGVAPMPPEKGAYFGAWVPPDGAGPAGSASPSPSGSPSDAASESPSESPPAAASPSGRPAPEPVRGFEQDLGRRLDIVHSYRGWKSTFPSRDDSALLAAGDRYLLLTWAGADTKEIVSGKHDAVIRERARAVRATGKPIFLRWSRDMDAPGARDRVHGGKEFVAAWKHIRAIFKAERVDNVAWVWCPTATGFGSRNGPSYYPGDDQVDWICVDAQPGAGYDYRDLSEVLKVFMDWAGERPKPIMVAEFGVPKAYGTRRAEWLRKAAETLQNPQVKAVVYFNSDEQAQESRDDRRKYAVTGDQKAVSALRELATTPYFNPRNLPVTSGE
ncbi:glycoside hydrolase family 26 protein [Actinomadura sp. 21ATH]|uniref:glycoside hydrolase family 26 protein n=1 Tax=Actinomadura sp. 21ATH TaxID=1735444 RepID=UPI0035C22620